MERLGLGPSLIHASHPNILYVRLSGYGQADKRAGHDGTYLAESGLLTRFRAAEDFPPVYPANIVADYCAGSLATFSLIVQKRIEAKPCQIIDSSMTHNSSYYGQIELLSNTSGFCPPYTGKLGINLL